MSAKNVEEFLLKFVFDDKEAVNKLKGISKYFDKANKAEAKATSSAIKGTRERTKAIKDETKALKERQNTLRRSIRRAKGLGIDTSSFERTARHGRVKPDTVARRNADLQELITKEELKQLDIKKKKADVDARSIRTTLQSARSGIDARKAFLGGLPDRSPKTTSVDRYINKQKTAELREQNALLRQQTAIQNKLDAFAASKVGRNLAIADQERLNNLLRGMESALRRGGRAGKVAYAQLREEANLYSKTLQTVQSRTLSLHTVQRGLNDSTRHLIRSYASMFAVLAGVKAINDTGKAFVGIKGSLTAATGSATLAADEMKYLEQMSLRLGLGIASTSEQYGKFLFAANGKLDTDQVRELFTNTAEAGKAMGVSQERMKLSFIALQQMMNKNQIKSEELKNQLAESFPGAVQIFAKAIGKTEQEMFKMMENGELIASDIFPAVAKEMKRVSSSGGALQSMLESAAGAQDRFFTSLERMRARVYSGAYSEGAGKFFKTMADTLNENDALIKGLSKTLKVVFDILTVGFRLLFPVVESFMHSFGSIADVVDQLFGTTGGSLTVGIALATVALKNLKVVLNSIYFRFFAILGVVDEVVSLFAKGRIGLIEKALGKDFGISDIGFNVEGIGVLAQIAASLATIAGALWAVKKAASSLLGVVAAKVGLDAVTSGGNPAKKGGSLKDLAKGALTLARTHPVLTTIGAGVTLYGIQQASNARQDAERQAQGLKPLSGMTRSERKAELNRGKIEQNNNINVNVNTNASPEEIGVEVERVLERQNRHLYRHSRIGGH